MYTPNMENQSSFREEFLQDRDRIGEHGIDSCHNYFGVSEQKYMLTEEDAWLFMKLLKKDYLVLKLDGIERHGYDNIYMDTKDFHLYERQGSKKYNFSVRTRSYTRNNAVFFQIQHDKHERANVYSHVYEHDPSQQMTASMRNRYSGIYEGIIGKKPEKLVFPALEISYDRYILYNKKHDERIDIDFNIRFKNLRDKKKPVYSLDNIVMIESKSSLKETQAYRILSKMKSKKSNVGMYPLALHYIGYPTMSKEIHKTAKKILKLQSITK